MEDELRVCDSTLSPSDLDSEQEALCHRDQYVEHVMIRVYEELFSFDYSSTFPYDIVYLSYTLKGDLKITAEEAFNYSRLGIDEGFTTERLEE
jgi:hypothetical protein